MNAPTVSSKITDELSGSLVRSLQKLSKLIEARLASGSPEQETELLQEKLEVVELYDRPIDEIVPCECYQKTKKACFYSARGNYINFLRLNNTIILPEYTLPTLRETKYYNNINKEILTQLGFQVKTINCDLLSKEGGSLHCLSYTF